jgi:HEAT repeat protein
MLSTLFLLGLVALALPSAARAQQPTFLNKLADQWGAELSSSNPDVRRSAAFALGKLGQAAARQVPKLLSLVAGDSDGTVREAAAFALGDICRQDTGARANPKVLPTLQNAVLNDKHELVRRSAAYALGCMGQQSINALKTLDAATGDSSLAVKQNVAWALGKLGKSGVLSLQKLVAAETDPMVVRNAANSLGEIGKDARPAIADLLRHLKDANPDPKSVEMRKSVLGTLVGLVDKRDTAAVEPLKLALKDTDLDVRRSAALALSNIGGPSVADAVPVLVEALQNEKAEIQYRRQAAAALRNIGPAAKDAVPSLLNALKSSDPELRTNAAVALGGIADPSCIAALAEVVADTKELSRVREHAAIALRDAGVQTTAEGKSARPELIKQLPLLIKVIEDPNDDPKVRATALWPFRFLDPDVVAQKPEVTQVLEKIVTSERKVPPTKMMRYDSACLLCLFQGPKVSAAAMNTINDFLHDDQVFIYTGITADPGRLPPEGTKPDDPKVKIKGRGDGRVVAVQALSFVGADKIREYPRIAKQLRTLADDPNTDKRLEKEIKRLLSSF